jgi:hypothetical protein
MADIILSTDNLVVTGGPASVNVDVDFGPQGQRGSLILYGVADPNTLQPNQFPQTPNALDWYINLNVSSVDYLFLYQYVSEGGPYTWRKIFKIIPNTYNVNKIAVFTNGQAVIPLEISNTTAPLLGSFITNESAINAHVTIQAESTFPIASNFYFDPLSFGYDEINGVYSVDLHVNAVEFSPIEGAISLDGNAIANISLNIVAPIVP